MTGSRYGDVSVTVSDNYVAVVEMHRPPHNFFDHELIRNLADAFEALDQDDRCRALVLAAEGKSFCAGANFSAHPPGSARPVLKTNPMYAEAVRLFACKKPVVAAVQGPAIGGGLGVAMVADFRVASPEARFAANFVKISFHPGFGLTHTLPRVIGQQKANLLFLTGRRVDGQTAYEWGLADQLSTAERVREDAIALAEEIAENGPLAVVATRATMRGDLADKVRAQTAHEHEEQTWMSTTADHAEGVKAVSERRPGRFIGK